jgi:hypothetical protein
LFKWAVDNATKPLPLAVIYLSHVDKQNWWQVAGEKMAQLSREYHGLNVRVYRSASLYGADLNVPYPFNELLDRVFLNSSSVQLIIDDIEDDFVYVDDAVAYIVNSLDTDSNKQYTTIASGTVHKLSHIAREMLKQGGINYNYEPTRNVENNKKPLLFVFTCQTCFRNISEGIKTVLAMRAQEASSTNDHEVSYTKVDGTEIKSKSETDSKRAESKKHFKGYNNEGQFGHRSGSGKKSKRGMSSPPRYSSYHCSGGNQNFRNWQPNSLGNNTFIANRVCMLENVCWTENQFVYFMHPEEAMSPAFIKYFITVEFVKLSHRLHMPWTLAYTHAPIPDEFEYKDDKTWTFTHASFSFNYAHLLIDDLFPILTAMDMFDVDAAFARVVYTGCNSLTGYTNYYTPTKSQAQACKDNFKIYSKLVLGAEGEDIDDWEKKSFCFKKLIVGSGHALGLVPQYPDKHRAIALRKGRDAIIKHLPKGDFISPHSLKVVIISKRNPGHLSDNFWSNMCSDVTPIINSIANVEVYCLEENLSIEEEIRVIRTATLIISEHGTVAYLALFAHDGAVLINISTQQDLKDIHVLPFTTHIRVFYTTLDVPEEFPPLLRYGLHLAATNFNLSLEDYLVEH